MHLHLADIDAPTAVPPSGAERRPLRRGEEHPLWERQVELERAMLMEGADRIRDRVVRARERGQMTRLSPVRGLMEDWLPGIAEALREWMKSCARTRGVRPIALEYLKPQDPFVMSLLAVRTILDRITDGRVALAGLAADIGRACEHEAMARAWEKGAPEDFWSFQKYLDRTQATKSHRRLANVNRFNHYLKANPVPGAVWQKWSGKVHTAVGLQLVDCVVRSTRWFETVPDPDHVYKRGQPHTYRAAWTIAPKAGLVEWLGKELEDAELRSPAFMPTVIPPKPWTDTRSGGYWTPYVRTPRLIRFKAHQEDQRERAADEYEAIDMPVVYEAVNFIQDVAWRINGRVLDVALELYRRGAGIAGLPIAQELGSGLIV